MSKLLRIHGSLLLNLFWQPCQPKIWVRSFRLDIILDIIGVEWYLDFPTVLCVVDTQVAIMCAAACRPPSEIRSFYTKGVFDVIEDEETKHPKCGTCSTFDPFQNILRRVY